MEENPYTAPDAQPLEVNDGESLRARFVRVSMTLIVGAMATINIAGCVILFPEYASLLIEHGTLPTLIVCYTVLFSLSAITLLYSAHQWNVGNFFRGSISLGLVMLSVAFIPRLFLKWFMG